MDGDRLRKVFDQTDITDFLSKEPLPDAPCKLPPPTSHVWSFGVSTTPPLLATDPQSAEDIKLRARNMIRELKATLAISNQGLRRLKDDKAGKPLPLYTTQVRHIQLKQKREDERKKKEELKERMEVQKAAVKQARRVIAEEEKAWEEQKQEEVAFKEALEKLKKRLREEQSTRPTPYEEVLGKLAERPRPFSRSGKLSSRKEELVVPPSSPEPRQVSPEPGRTSPGLRTASAESGIVSPDSSDTPPEYAGRTFQLASMYFDRWRSRVKASKELESKAVMFYSCKTLQSCWLQWRKRTKQSICRRAEEEFRQRLLKAAAKNRMATQHYNTTLLRKSWRQWKMFVKKRRLERRVREDEESRRERVRSFLASLKETYKKGSRKPLLAARRIAEAERIYGAPKKKGVVENVTTVYANRLETQKAIIQEQQVRLKEQQTMIETLRLDRKKSPPRKKLPQKPAPAVRKTEPPPPPAFLLHMQSRAEERVKRREELEALQRQKLEEKERRQKKMEEERARLEVQERKKRVAERARLVQERKAQAEKMAALDQMARAHYRTWLLHRGINAFRAAVQARKDDTAKADMHHRRQTVQHAFRTWLDKTRRINEEKEFDANELYKLQLTRRCLRWWKEARLEGIRKLQAAEDFHEMNLMTRCLQGWAAHTLSMKIQRWRQEEVARKHHERKIMKRCLRKWTNLKHVLREERIAHSRRRRWREKVLEVVPDFRPPGSSSDEDI